MKTINLFLICILLSTILHVSYAFFLSRDNVDLLSNAHAINGEGGEIDFAKLKRIDCLLPGNVFVRIVDGTIDLTAQYSTEIGASAGGQYQVFTYQYGSQGYYSDCRFNLIRDCNTSDVNFACRVADQIY